MTGKMITKVGDNHDNDKYSNERSHRVENLAKDCVLFWLFLRIATVKKIINPCSRLSTVRG